MSMLYVSDTNIRNIHGVLFLDKPKGKSSCWVLNKIKKLFCAAKAGHAGTLDPLATGMLPICFGQATKFIKYLINFNKFYRVSIILGIRTDTADCEGSILYRRIVQCDFVQFSTALEYFKGEIFQIPPMFSALKYRGRALYRYAREGLVVPRASRLVNIYDIKLVKWDNSRIVLDIFCSKGTYIRALIDDIGEYLGCGACVMELRRTGVEISQCKMSSMISLAAIEDIYDDKLDYQSRFITLDSLLYPMDISVCYLPMVHLSSNLFNNFRYGRKVYLTVLTQNGLVRVTTGLERVFVGVGKIIDMYLYPIRLILLNI